MRKWFVLFIVMWISPWAAAFDVSPEYQGLSESDLKALEGPQGIDSEYQIIANGFFLPLEWERFYQSQRRAADLSIGSLGNKNFLIYSRVKTEADLLETLRFQFNYVAQRDRETDQLRHVLELSQRLTTKLRLNVYGEPSFYKRENDMGVALVSEGERWSHRLYYTLHDLTRAEHNDLADKFRGGRDPRSLGLASVYSGDEVWARFGVRYDQPVTWDRPQEQRVYSYSKKLIYGDAIWTLNPGSRVGIRLQWDETFEGQEPDSATSTVVAESWRLQRLQSRLSYFHGAEGDRLGYGAAFSHVHRKWTGVDGRSLQHFNEMPSAELRLRAARREHGFDHVRIEYEFAWYSRFGAKELAPDQKQSPHEQRLQTGYEFNFKGDARLMLAFNFDMDEWTPAPTFEGGQGIFRTTF